MTLKQRDINSSPNGDETQQVNAELEAMKTIADALKGFDGNQRTRVMSWVIKRLDIYMPDDLC